MKLAALLPLVLVGVIFLPFSLAGNGRMNTGPNGWSSLVLEPWGTYQFAFKSEKEGKFELWIDRYSTYTKPHTLYHYSVYSHPACKWQNLTITPTDLHIFNRVVSFPYYLISDNNQKIEMKIKSVEIMKWKDCSTIACEFQTDQTQKPPQEEKTQKPPSEEKEKTYGLSRFGVEMIVASVGFCLFAVNVFIDVREYRAGKTRPRGDNGTAAPVTRDAAAAAPAVPRTPAPVRGN